MTPRRRRQFKTSLGPIDSDDGVRWCNTCRKRWPRARRRCARPVGKLQEARQDGRYDIPKDDPAYWDGGDREHDGYACES